MLFLWFFLLCLLLLSSPSFFFLFFSSFAWEAGLVSWLGVPSPSCPSTFRTHREEDARRTDQTLFSKALRHLGSAPLKRVDAQGALKTTSQSAEELVRAEAKSWQSTWTRQLRGRRDARKTGQILFLKALRHLGSVPLRGSAPKAF